MAITNGDYAGFIVGRLGPLRAYRNVRLERQRNTRLLVEFTDAGTTYKFRLLLHAVSLAARSNPLETRVEITSTYLGGNLQPEPGYSDAVLGVERDRELLVGIDPRRLTIGGAGHNASTFVYSSNFEQLSRFDHFTVAARQVSFPSEYQVYFRPEFLLQYLRDHAVLHSSGAPAAVTAAPPPADETALAGRRRSTRRLTYEELKALALRKMEIGQLGERIAYDAEKRRLSAAGAGNLAGRVNWISQQQPFLGYDIQSFNVHGQTEYVEVKASVGNLDRFYITSNELAQARRYGDRYRLVCVSNVYARRPTFSEYRDPVARIAADELRLDCVTSMVRIA
jgi:hypothetical protein